MSQLHESVACRKIDVMGKDILGPTWTAEWTFMVITVALYAVKCV
jgi:hypothetical protein